MTLSGFENGVINVGSALGAACVPPIVSACVAGTALGYRSLPLLVLGLTGLCVVLVEIIVLLAPAAAAAAEQRSESKINRD